MPQKRTGQQATNCAFSLHRYAVHLHLHSFPTRRSSDLAPGGEYQRWPRRPRPAVCSSAASSTSRSEEHTSELQSRGHLVCRLLLEKKKVRPALVSAARGGYSRVPCRYPSTS